MQTGHAGSTLYGDRWQGALTCSTQHASTGTVTSAFSGERCDGTGVARIPKAMLPDGESATVERDTQCHACLQWMNWVVAGPYLWNAYAIHGTGQDRRYLALYPVPGALWETQPLSHRQCPTANVPPMILPQRLRISLCFAWETTRLCQL